MCAHCTYDLDATDKNDERKKMWNGVVRKLCRAPHLAHRSANNSNNIARGEERVRFKNKTFSSVYVYNGISKKKLMINLMTIKVLEERGFIDQMKIIIYVSIEASK